MSQAISVSPWQVDETAFVAKALKEGLRHSDITPTGAQKPFKNQENWEAYRVVNPLVNDMLTKATVLVARRHHRPLGFVVFLDVDDVALVWVYVRKEERRQNVAKTLLAAALDEISPSASLEAYFPTSRWAEKAAGYGFFVPESL